MAFVDATHLTSHKRIHTGDKPCKCEHCEKRFRTSSELAVHRRHHTGERPYHCQFCDKKFAKFGGLKVHERTHTGEKPYHCEHCGASFSHSSAFYYHQRNVCPTEIVGTVSDHRRAARKTPYALKQQLQRRRNGAPFNQNIIIVTEVCPGCCRLIFDFFLIWMDSPFSTPEDTGTFFVIKK